MTHSACRYIGCRNHIEPGMAWCLTHQLNLWARMDPDLRERFAARMVEGITTNASGCWLYSGYRNPATGYAAPLHGGRRTTGHRWMFWHLKAPLKPGYDLHHICGGIGEEETRHCIRPAHLVQVLPSDHKELTRLRAQMIAAAKSGSRFYQTNPGETGRTVAFAGAHDLPRHEVDYIDAASPEVNGLVAVWKLVIPARFHFHGTIPDGGGGNAASGSGH
ncbi:UNVERIFIED_CONTAM: hypothetical protein RF653_03500 [Kocuria sp. CPCC 205316]|uniref:hypothetical protein n=1 Tax=Kocuria TaxID=57493 RepID=UPI0036DDA7A3